MKDAALALAASLVLERKVAALSTLHDCAPALSLVPYAPVTEPLGFLVLLSALAAHTRDLRADPRAALLVAAPESAGALAHALARVALRVSAVPIARNAPRFAAARAVYEGRFPDMAMLFELGDFELFALEPTTVRLVTGFAEAYSTTPASFARALAAAGAVG